MNSHIRCTITFFVILAACCEGQQNITFPSIPKCCKSRQDVWRNNTCNKLDQVPSYNHFFFQSNATHINNEKIDFNPTFYHQNLNCIGKYPLKDNEILGFIYNGSIITADNKVEIISPTKYCVDAIDQKIVFLFCVDDVLDPVSKAEIYFPCLIVSTICYFCSAFIYQFVLKVKDVHKKCFIGYSLSMGITFLCLILLQKIESGCNFIGSTFFLFILSSFVWLCCLCLDMVYVVKNFMQENQPERIYLFIAASVLIPCVIIVISIVPTGIPDVPTSFMKGRGMCFFKEARIAILFVPVGLLLFASVASLVYTFYLISQNKTVYKSDINWLEKQSLFKYMTRSCCLVWLTTTIWVLDAFFDNMKLGNPLVYEIIEGSQGIFIVAIFVLNRYTRKDIYKALFGTTRTRADTNRFNDLLEKFNKNKRRTRRHSTGSLEDAER